MKAFVPALALGVSALNALAQNLVLNDGFEDPVSSGQPPSGYGYWGYDKAASVGPTLGIVPHGEQGMLQFLGTGVDGGHCGATGCEQLQLIDTSGYLDLIRSGQAVATASAWVNRVAGGKQSDTAFGLGVWAVAGDPSQFPAVLSAHGWIEALHVEVLSDSDPVSWELVKVNFCVPANTDYLAVYFYARENVQDDCGNDEFDGHFGDDVSLEVLQRPSCPPDLTGDCSLNLFDFLMFTNLFNAGDAAADFDNNGALDLFDFLTFVNAFNAGC